jgi:hypothetical protein
MSEEVEIFSVWKKFALSAFAETMILVPVTIYDRSGIVQDGFLGSLVFAARHQCHGEAAANEYVLHDYCAI